MSFQRIAGLAGFVFIALLVANMVLLGDQPMAGDSTGDVRNYLGSDENLHKTALFISMLALPFAIVFFAGVVSKIRASDRAHDEGWGIVTLLGAVLLGAAAGVGDVLFATMLFRSGEGLDDTTLRALWDGQTIAYASTGIALTALTVGVAVPTLIRGLWPMWYGFLSLLVAVLGVLALISTVSDTNGGNVFAIIGFASMAVWAVATGVEMVVHAPDEARAPRQVVPPASPAMTA